MDPNKWSPEIPVSPESVKWKLRDNTISYIDLFELHKNDNGLKQKPMCCMDLRRLAHNIWLINLKQFDILEITNLTSIILNILNLFQFRQ